MDGEQVLNPSTGEVFRATDPVVLPQPYVKPTDFAAQYPTPLDPTELIAMCEEVTLLQSIPKESTMLYAHTWREMTSLEFASGSSYIAFADGECPEEYTHDGANTTITLKNIGAKKSLGISDLMHSRAVAGANWHGINTLVAPAAAGEGMPGGLNDGTFDREYVADVKAKEIRLAATLVMNGDDRLLVLGDTNTNTLEYDGIEEWQTNNSVTFHTNSNTASGTFSGIAFDRFLSESCAKPDTLMGHPQTMQEVLSAYFQLGYQGSQLVNHPNGDRIVPGFNFAGQVNTGIGRLNVLSDNNFTRTAAGTGIFQADVWAMRMRHNGEPLVYQLEQIPMALKDLVPGCTAISFQIWAKKALIIKHACAHGQYTSQFTGRIVTTCSVIG